MKTMKKGTKNNDQNNEYSESDSDAENEIYDDAHHDLLYDECENEGDNHIHEYSGNPDTPSIHGIHAVSNEIYMRAKRFIESTKQKADVKRQLELESFRKPINTIVAQRDIYDEGVNTHCAENLLRFNTLYSRLKTNSEQLEAFHIVAAHILQQPSVFTEDNVEGQLRMFISGQAGSGKSDLIHTIKQYAQIQYGYDGTKYGSVLIITPTGISAFNVKGHTVESVLPIWMLHKKENNPDYIRNLQELFGNVSLVIIDEISMVSSIRLGKIDKCFKIAKQEPGKIMGGVHYILIGDFYQLPPPMGRPLYESSSKRMTLDIENAGINVYNATTTFVELIHNYRAAKDPTFQIHLENLRKGTATEKDFEYFQNRTYDSISDPQITELPMNTLFVSSTNDMCRRINQLKVDELITAANSKAIYIWAQHRTTLGNKGKFNADIDNENVYIADDDLRKCTQLPIEQRIHLLTSSHDPDRIKLLPSLRLTIGSRVMLTTNPDPKLGLFHGAMGTVLGLYYYDNDLSASLLSIPEYAQGPCNAHCSSAKVAAEYQFQIPIILVQFDSRTYTGDSFVPSGEISSIDNVVPVTPISISYKDQGVSITRTQLPLVLSSCVTIHKCQGLSLQHIVWILGKFFKRGIGYVAAGRATTGSGLFIVRNDNFQHYSESQMNDYQNQLYDIHEEYARLTETKRVEARRIAEDTIHILGNSGPVSYAALPNIAKMGSRPLMSPKKKRGKIIDLTDKKKHDASIKSNRSNGFTDSTSVNTNFWNLNADQMNDTTSRLNLIVQLAGTSQQDHNRTFCHNSTYGDVASLHRQNWLTGGVINHILSIILQKYDRHNIVLLPDYFYAQLTQSHRGYNFTDVSDYIRRKFVENPALMNSDILFPIHVIGYLQY